MAVPIELLDLIRAQVHRKCAEVEKRYTKWKRSDTPTPDEVNAAIMWDDIARATRPTFENQARVFAAAVRTHKMAMDDIPTRHLRMEVRRLMGMDRQDRQVPEPEPAGGLAWL